MSTSYKDKDDGEGSDTSSTASSSSSEERKRSLKSSSSGSIASPTSSSLGHSNNNQQQQFHEEDEDWNEDDERAMGKGLLTHMESRTNSDDDRYNKYHDDGIEKDSRPSEMAKKRQQRRKIAAGVAGAAAGLVMLGPCTAVAAGVAGAMLIRRYDRKRQQEAKTLTKGDNELASLISPRAEV